MKKKKITQVFERAIKGALSKTCVIFFNFHFLCSTGLSLAYLIRQI